MAPAASAASGCAPVGAQGMTNRMTSTSLERPPTGMQRPDAVRPPRISVVMAVLNGEAGLRRALDSIEGQTYPDVEIVVMDGGSTDGTLDILRGYGSRIAHWESGPDTGVFNAWNKALDHVTGDWICFLGADDWYAGNDVMARVAAWIAEDGAAHDVYYGHMDRYLPGGRVSHARERRWSRERRKRFRRGVMFPHPASFTSRAQFEAVGRFDESFAIAGDYEHLLRILKRGACAQFMDILVVNMTAGGISQQPRNRMRIAREVYRARYKQGLVSTPGWRSPSLWRTLTRTWMTYRLRPALKRITARLPAPR
jgi:glycosyltransferase involved in cell wall biosynthesis